MAETCIVCLGDLRLQDAGSSDVPSKNPLTVPTATEVVVKSKSTIPDPDYVLRGSFEHPMTLTISFSTKALCM
jgi:hypothetical protein